MRKFSNIATIALAAFGVLVLGGMGYALIVSKGRTIFPIRMSVHHEPVDVPEIRIWVSAWENAFQNQLSPEQFEEIVKANLKGRDYALGLFAHSKLTNHVRILVKHGADTSEEALDSLRLSGMSNAASLILWVVNDLNQSSSNGVTSTNIAPASLTQ